MIVREPANRAMPHDLDQPFPLMTRELEPERGLGGGVRRDGLVDVRTLEERAPAGEIRVEIEEREESSPDARVSGPHKAWIAALGPDGDRSGLKFEGDRSLAEALLDGVSAAAASNSRAA